MSCSKVTLYQSTPEISKVKEFFFSRVLLCFTFFAMIQYLKHEFLYVIKLTDFITKNEFYMYIVHTIVSYFLPLYSILRTNFICILYIQCYLCFICFAIIKYHKNITRHVFIDLRNRHMQKQKTHSLLDL